MDITGLQAFEKIMKIYGDTNSLEGTYELFLKIKHDLERLEALEKENKKWREIVGCDLCEALGREILLEENEKLKKAIEILKGFDFDIYSGNGLGFIQPSIDEPLTLTQEEYELLKEVFENEL